MKLTLILFLSLVMGGCAFFDKKESNTDLQAASAAFSRDLDKVIQAKLIAAEEAKIVIDCESKCTIEAPGAASVDFNDPRHAGQDVAHIVASKERTKQALISSFVPAMVDGYFDGRRQRVHSRTQRHISDNNLAEALSRDEVQREQNEITQSTLNTVISQQAELLDRLVPEVEGNDSEVEPVEEEL